MAQTLMKEQGIMPDQFYNNSFSNWLSAQNAESKEERMTPLERMRSLQ